MSSRYALNLSRSLVLLPCLGITARAAAQDTITFDCGSNQGIVGEESECIDATITDGATTIKAGRFVMRNLDRDQGEWRLTDGIVILRSEAELTADSAVIERVDGEYTSFVLEGSPSRIRLIPDDDETPVSAEATSIVYDVASSELELKGDVNFIFGENVFNTCELSYNLNERSYTTGPCGVRATVRQSETETDSQEPQRDGR